MFVPNHYLILSRAILESVEVSRASKLWKSEDPLYSSAYGKLLLCCCKCLHACGKVDVTMLTAGQEPLYQETAKWSHHLSLMFSHTLYLISTCLLSSGQFELMRRCFCSLFVGQEKSASGNVLIDNRCQELNGYTGFQLAQEHF